MCCNKTDTFLVTAVIRLTLFLLTAVLRRTLFSILKSVGIRWTNGGIRQTLFCCNKADTFIGIGICWKNMDTIVL